MPRLLYQRFLEVDAPEGVGAGVAPMWSWPVPLGDGWTVLTLLYRSLGAPGAARMLPRTQVLLISPEGEAEVWGPGLGYPSPVVFFANSRGHLLGFDLTNPQKIYACLRDGTHLWTLETAIRLDNLIAPASFFEAEGKLYWMTAANVRMSADVSAGAPRDVRACENAPAGPLEVRHPHTHLVRGKLFVLEFDPLARISCYEVGEKMEN